MFRQEQRHTHRRRQRVTMVWWRTGSRTARILRIANPLSFAATATVNGLGGAGIIGRGVGQVSDENPTDLTPASFAFSIWGLIYFHLALFCVYSAVPRLRHIGNEDGQYPLLTRRIGWLFVTSNVANAAWILTFVWGTELAIWISCCFITALEGCLIAIYIRADLWQTHRESVFEFWAVDIAFSMYLGWCACRACSDSSVNALTNCQVCTIQGDSGDDPQLHSRPYELRLGWCTSQQGFLPYGDALSRRRARAADAGNAPRCGLSICILLGGRSYRV